MQRCADSRVCFIPGKKKTTTEEQETGQKKKSRCTSLHTAATYVASIASDETMCMATIQSYDIKMQFHIYFYSN